MKYNVLVSHLAEFTESVMKLVIPTFVKCIINIETL